ncbi:MAG: zinc ribbon domain-containing protein [Nitrospirae bacterium]|nr:zinc ribbon domain-containing protein [Nitrospirota bacterium]
MPIYEYVCQSCQHRFEVKQKFSDPPVSNCVRCGNAVMKVISPPAIMFKGSGWYVTDYSEKLKPSAQPESAGKPANGQKDQKEPVVTSTSQTATTTSKDSPVPSSSVGAGSDSAPSGTSTTPSSSS